MIEFTLDLNVHNSLNQENTDCHHDQTCSDYHPTAGDRADHGIFFYPELAHVLPIDSQEDEG